VVLADDHRDFIAKVRAILADEFEVIQVAENGNQAVRAVLAMDPDVLVTDISKPILDGLQAARTIQEAHCRAKIVFLTIHEGGDFIAAAFSAGGTDYVTKRPVDRSGFRNSRVDEGPYLRVQFYAKLNVRSSFDSGHPGSLGGFNKPEALDDAAVGTQAHFFWVGRPT
jgi:CheY-like chemotaxis protein